MVNRSNRASIIALAIGHGVIDLYANFLPALLPFFEDSFDLSKTSVGVLISAVGVSGSLCQVFYGYLGDRWGVRYFLVPGPAVAAIFMCFIGLSPNFLVLLLLLLAGGMGVSAFHPSAASFAGDTAGSRRGFGLSIFMAVGTVGFAAGPLVATEFILRIGPGRMPLISIIGIVMSLLLYKYVIPEKKSRKTHSFANVMKIIRPHLKILTSLCIIVILRATVCIVFINFISLLIKQRGLSLTVGGRVIFLFVLATALGTILGGYFSDRMSRRKLLVFSLLLSFPFFVAVVYTEGVALAIFLILSGIMIGCSNPVPLSIAQELIPDSVSTASSLMMGLSWGVASLAALFFGVLADFFGGDVAPSMIAASCLPVLAVIFVLPLSRELRK